MKRLIIFVALLTFGVAAVALPVSAAPAGPAVVKLTNPIGGTGKNPAGETSIHVIVGKAIQKALGVLGSITFMVFVYGGFLWLTSAGNSDNVKKGMETMLWAAIGVCIIFASYAILQFVINGLTAS